MLSYPCHPHLCLQELLADMAMARATKLLKENSIPKPTFADVQDSNVRRLTRCPCNSRVTLDVSVCVA